MTGMMAFWLAYLEGLTGFYDRQEEPTPAARLSRLEESEWREVLGMRQIYAVKAIPHRNSA
jgi:hypothetical protein